LTDINKKISEAKNSLDAKQLYISSFDLYKGNFLSNIGSLNWCIPIVETYHSMFFNMVYSLLDIFNQESDFINMILFAKKAISIDKFDENCNRYIMLGLSKTGHPLQALGHYNYLKNLYYDELDTVLSKETEQLYITISKTTKKENIELISLLNEIEESPYSSDTPIFCEFEIFKQFYHLTAKSSSRQHSNSSILLLNLTDKNDKLLPLEKRQEAMNNLFNCISNTIRREDIFCRCSLNQYLIILNNVDDKSAIRVVTRIKEKHSKLYSNKKIKLTVKSHEIV
ncbi:MAG: BTAD domain-containing putative transcriptional regulator, partial [Oscillospiraceae bacterium]